MTVPDGPDTDRTEELVVPGPAEGDLLAGRYELRRLLGVGGMSRVYLAHDRELGRSVAVKLLLRSGGDEDVGRLRDEARAAASIEHPGVVTVHDVGATTAGVHVVMSYVEGESLAQRIERDGPLPPAAVVAIGLAVCDALGAAHRAGVVHRDVSPGNVMLRPDGGVTVTDFGIARVGPGAGRTTTGYIVGTPSYIAPEQARGDGVVDGRADLYALACSLFAALTGRPPFTDADSVSVVLAHLRETPPRPSALRDGVPPALERTLLRALAKDPDHRHRDAARMAADLAASVAGGAPGHGAGPGVPAPTVRTRELPGPSGADTVPSHEGRGAVGRTVADAEDSEGVASDRRRTAGTALLAVAGLLLLALVVAMVVLG